MPPEVLSEPAFKVRSEPAFTPAALHEGELLARLVVEVGAAFCAVPVEHDQAQLW